MKRTFLGGIVIGVVAILFAVAAARIGLTDSALAATRIQYKVVETTGNAQGFQQALDQYGTEGWELVGSSLHILFLKKQQ